MGRYCILNVNKSIHEEQRQLRTWFFIGQFILVFPYTKHFVLWGVAAREVSQIFRKSWRQTGHISEIRRVYRRVKLQSQIVTTLARGS
jgi:hypothetical protein